MAVLDSGIADSLIMPGLSSLGLLPAGHEATCWRDECTRDILQVVSLQVCGDCKVARYCSQDCQRKDWKARHRSQCKQTKELAPAAKNSVRPSERMESKGEEFPDDVMGMLLSDCNVLGAPQWRFMKLTQQVQELTRLQLHRLTKAQWCKKYALPEVRVALHEVWAAAYVGELPGLSMAAVMEERGIIGVRDILRTLSADDAAGCVRRLAPFGLVLVLVRRPPREMREAISQGSLGEGNRRVGFVFTPLTSAEVAGTQPWEKIIHLSVAASGTLADHQ